MSAPATTPTGRKVSTRAVLLGVAVVSLLLAGLVSFYAASSPDGLTKVSEDQKFAESETGHHTADGPLAGYGVRGVDDDRVSVGLAGVAGVLVVLGLGSGLAYALRRRPEQNSAENA